MVEGGDDESLGAGAGGDEEVEVGDAVAGLNLFRFELGEGFGNGGVDRIGDEAVAQGLLVELDHPRGAVGEEAGVDLGFDDNAGS